MAHQQLGGPAFSYQRMSWIKPNFLWMMYRCGWAKKQDQERLEVPSETFLHPSRALNIGLGQDGL
ncbi:MAG: hypothetical protein ACI81P_002365 [Neolewinella sp.]